MNKIFGMRFCVLFFFLILTIKIFPQEQLFRFYGVEQGLSSTEVYCGLQDDEGYVWFGTSRGVSRFDGYEFSNYTASDGLPANSVIKMFSDKWGRIWFSTYDGSLSYYEHGKIKHFPHNDSLLQLDKHYYVMNLFFDNDSVLWVMPARGGIFKFYPDGKIEKIKIKAPVDERAFFFKEKGDNFVFTTIKGKKTQEPRLYKHNDSIFITGFKTAFRHNILKLEDKKFLVSLGSELFLVSDTLELLQTYENDITGLYKDTEGNIWVTVMFDGAYKFLPQDLKNYKQKFFYGKTPAPVFQDSEGGYWFTTIESGVYYTPSFQFNVYPISENITAMALQNNTLYLSTFDKSLLACRLKNENLLGISTLTFTEKSNYAINDILATQDGIYFLSRYLVKLKDKKFQVIDRISGGYRLFKTKNGHILSTVSGGFKEFVNDTVFYEYKKQNFLISNAIYRQKDITWLGSVTGLYSHCKDNDTLFYWGNVNPLLKARINDIQPYGKYLLLATNGSGLFIFNPEDTSLFNFTSMLGLSSNFVNAIFVDKDIIWLGTNKGLTKLQLFFDTAGIKFKAIKFTKADGLASEEIKRIVKNGDFIFLATSGGLISFQPEKLKKTKTTPLLKLQKILVNDFEIKNQDEIILKPKQNNITFIYKGISYRADGKIIYRYKLFGLDERWSRTTEKQIRFPNLPPGKYRFELYASIDGVNWTPNPVKVEFYVKKPFTQTIFFYLLVAFVLIIIGHFVLWLRYRNIQRRLEIRKRLIASEQKALRSQMNPHFIFNALNSIRRYILENDPDKADYYLTSFAILMRKVLDNSKKDLIPLSEEIETLKLYTELEKMRFDDKFDFELIIDENIDTSDIQIPPMLIQPLLENAIWHGLAPKQGKGKLLLKLELTKKNYLQITVLDNGIGRDKAAEISSKRKGHKSTGIQNIKDRIRYFSFLTKTNMKLEYEDLYDAQGNPAGTKVILIIDFQSLKKLF